MQNYFNLKTGFVQISYFGRYFATGSFEKIVFVFNRPKVLVSKAAFQKYFR